MSTFYLFLVSPDNISSEPEKYSYDDSALWSLDATLAPAQRGTTRPHTLAQRLAAHRVRGESVEIELVGALRWRVSLRAVGTTWCSGETSDADPRGVMVSYRALTAVRGLWSPEWVDAPVADARVVGVSMVQAAAQKKKKNPRVALGAGGSQHVGVVEHLGEDYLELVPRRGLGPATGRPPGFTVSGQGYSSPQSLVIPLASVDYLRWLEPGDSF